MPVQDPKMTLVAKRLLRIPRIATMVAAVLVVAVPYATFHDTYADSSQNSTLSDSSQGSNLADISKFVSDFCVQLPTSGDRQSLTIDGKAQAKVDTLIKMLVDFNIEGSVNFDTSKYFNVLQEDLAPQLTDVRNCKLIIWKDIKHRIPGLKTVRTTPAISQAPRKTGKAVFHLELNNPTLQGHATSVSFSPNDDVLAVVMEIRDERLVRILDTSNWQEVAELSIEDGNIFESRFSPDGRFLVLAGYLNGVAVYDRENEWTRFSVDVHTRNAHDFAFIPGEGNTIVTASRDGRACIVNLEAPRAAPKCFYYELENGNNDPLFSVAVSQNGQEIATGSTYGVIYRWNIRDHSTPLWISSPYKGWIYDLEYSQENDLLIAAVDNEGIFGIPVNSQTNNAIFSDSAHGPFIQLNSSGDRIFALMDSITGTEIISYSMSIAAPVFSFSEDSYFNLQEAGTWVSPGSIFDFEVSTSNRYIALAGKNVLVVELQ